jgi:hypothetical protein
VKEKNLIQLKYKNVLFSHNLKCRPMSLGSKNFIFILESLIKKNNGLVSIQPYLNIYDLFVFLSCLVISLIHNC